MYKQLYEKKYKECLLITALNDEVLATALLDRLLYRCELIQLSGESYRMKNRRTIFAKDGE